ncbi:sodium-dependent transporter [Arhodomonas sp. AD133]|uniref:sodium-dependent transporter n=1 Tax=Arhodomonas sp. AD133 TaxID=3415009 RepID=UPI003EBBFA5E
MRGNQTQGIHGEWSNALVFVLAAVGSAVGLGNIWKFPYMAGENGGGAFVLVYLLCIAVIGLPILVAEITLGRRARCSPIHAFRNLAAQSGASPGWRYIGWLGVFTGFVILSFYSVVGGWAIAYTLRAGQGLFSGIAADEAGALFGGLLGSPPEMIAWHTLFMAAILVIVARGVHSGLERAVTFLMPALFVLLAMLVGYAMAIGDFDRAVTFLFRPDWSALNAEGVLQALGHAFFTLSLGIGCMLTYGAYLPARASILGTAVVIGITDTVVALFAGLAIFPVVFVAPGVEAGAGPGLLFQTLPYAFGQMPAGHLFGFLFFLLVTFAAVTSGISLVEPATAYLVERRGWGRWRACGLLCLGIWLLGLGTVFSFNRWADFTPLAFVGALADRNVFELLDGLTSGLLLPIGGFGIAIFAGWFAAREVLAEELRTGSWRFVVWRWAVRVVSPVAVALILLHGLGVI